MDIKTETTMNMTLKTGWRSSGVPRLALILPVLILPVLILPVLILPVLILTMAPTQAAPPSGLPRGKTAALAQQAPSATARINQLGPENAKLAQRAGMWDVVETVWASPGAAPTSIKVVAERRMIGMFLQEILRPTPRSQKVLRIDYLSFNRVEGRWEYVSMETRAPVGIMTAQSFGRGESGRIGITFQPFAIPAATEGAGITGQLLQMNQLIVRQDSNHDRKDQFFVLADGSGKSWMGHRYAYVRRP